MYNIHDIYKFNGVDNFQLKWKEVFGILKVHLVFNT